MGCAKHKLVLIFSIGRQFTQKTRHDRTVYTSCTCKLSEKHPLPERHILGSRICRSRRNRMFKRRNLQHIGFYTVINGIDRVLPYRLGGKTVRLHSCRHIGGSIIKIHLFRHHFSIICHGNFNKVLSVSNQFHLVSLNGKRSVARHRTVIVRIST